MASVDAWAGLAAGLNTLGSSMQQRQQQAWQQKLREQEQANELARQKALMQYRSELARKDREGTLIGAPTATPDGQYMAWQYGPDNTISRNVLGQMSEAEMQQMQQQQAAQQRLAEIDLQYKQGRLTQQEAAVQAANARAMASRASASLSRAKEEDLRSGGTGRAGDSGSRSGKGGSTPKTSDIKNAEQVAEMRALRELGLETAPFPDNKDQYDQYVRVVQKHYENVLDESGNRGGPGSSRSNPLTINPGDPEPPVGTWIRVPSPNAPSGWVVVQHTND